MGIGLDWDMDVYKGLLPKLFFNFMILIIITMIDRTIHASQPDLILVLKDETYMHVPDGLFMSIC